MPLVYTPVPAELGLVTGGVPDWPEGYTQADELITENLEEAKKFIQVGDVVVMGTDLVYRRTPAGWQELNPHTGNSLY